MISQRCKQCKIKNILVSECKCKNFYCTKHRLPEIHECIELQCFKKEAYDKNTSLLKTNQKEKVDLI